MRMPVRFVCFLQRTSATAIVVAARFHDDLRDTGSDGQFQRRPATGQIRKTRNRIVLVAARRIVIGGSDRVVEAGPGGQSRARAQ